MTKEYQKKIPDHCVIREEKYHREILAGCWTILHDEDKPSREQCSACEYYNINCKNSDS